MLTMIMKITTVKVISGLSLMASLSMSSGGSVDRAPARCSGGHGFDSRRGLRYFSLFHARVIVDHFIFINKGFIKYSPNGL